MRLTLLLICILIAGVLPAQSFKHQHSKLQDVRLNDSIVQKKWSINTFSGIETSFMAFKGGHATMVSAPMGIQINRFLNNNVFAFASLSIAPGYINFTQTAFIPNEAAKGFSNSFTAAGSQFTINPRARVGIGYTSDERTFQITGSIGVERSSYPYSSFNSFNGFGVQRPGF
jgi:hypothetical protein